MKKVRFKFSADIVIEGDNMQDVREKWEMFPLFSADALDNGVEFCETLLIEDAETNEDLVEEYEESY